MPLLFSTSTLTIYGSPEFTRGSLMPVFQTFSSGGMGCYILHTLDNCSNIGISAWDVLKVKSLPMNYIKMQCFLKELQLML